MASARADCRPDMDSDIVSLTSGLSTDRWASSSADSGRSISSVMARILSPILRVGTLDLDDPGIELLAHRDHFLGIGDLALAELGEVDQAFHTVLELSERPEVGDLDDFHAHFLPDLVFGLDQRPGVGLHLLQSEGQPLILFIDVGGRPPRPAGPS